MIPQGEKLVGLVVVWEFSRKKHVLGAVLPLDHGDFGEGWVRLKLMGDYPPRLVDHFDRADPTAPACAWAEARRIVRLATPEEILTEELGEVPADRVRGKS